MMTKKPDHGPLADLTDEEFLLFLLQLGSMMLAMPATASLSGSRAPLVSSTYYMSKEPLYSDKILGLAHQYLYDLLNHANTKPMCDRWYGSTAAAQAVALASLPSMTKRSRKPAG